MDTLAVDGELDGCNIVATRSEGREFVVVKAVNPQDRARKVEIELTGGFTPKIASMQIVAPGSLRARNTLEKPTAVKAEVGVVTLTGKRDCAGIAQA